MIDAVPTTARRASLQPGELGDQSRVVQQFHSAAVQKGQKLPIQVRARLLGYTILKAELDWPMEIDASETGIAAGAPVASLWP